MLTGIGLRNFKAFGERMQELPLSKITLIYGPNSGGKSSIIHALLLLKQSLNDGYQNRDKNLVPNGDLVDLGSWQSLIYKHDTDRDVCMDIKYRNLELFDDAADNSIGMVFSDGNLRSVNYKIASHKNNEVLFESKTGESTPIIGFRNAQVKLLDRDLEMFSGFADSFLPTILLPDWARGGVRARARTRIRARGIVHSRFEVDMLTQALIRSQLPNDMLVRALALIPPEELETELEVRRSPEEAPEGPLRYRSWLFRSWGDSWAQSQATEESLEKALAIALELEEVVGELKPEQIVHLTPENIPGDYERHLRLVSYLGPLRSAPQRLYKLLNSRDASASITGVKGEFSANVLYRSDRIKSEVNRWFKQDKFNIPYTLDVRNAGEAMYGDEYIRIVLTDKRNDTEVTLADVGYGINQILPIIIEGIASQEGSIVCVEQPEIHIHPRLQAHVADLMIDTIDDKDGKRKQWIVETHSELLVRRIQTRIAQGDISPSDVCVLYVDPNDDDDYKGSAIKELRLDETGSWLDEWPQGFFEEGHEQTMAVVNARMNMRASKDVRERQLNRRAKNGAD